MANLTSTRHSQAREALSSTFAKVSQLNSPIEASQLQGLGINASPLDLDDEEHFPRYFLPMPAEKLAGMADLRPKTDTTTTTDWFWEDCSIMMRGELISAIVTSHTQNFTRVKYGGSCVMDSTPWVLDECSSENGLFQSALEEGEYNDERWQLHFKYDTHEHGRPHLMGLLHNDQIVGEPFVRSDLLCAMGLIIDRMEHEWSQSHLIFPVMLLSFSGSRARIIHAHFDGSIFHFRHSRYYDFMDLSEETIDLFVRWLSNEPIGDTAIVAAMDDHNPGISHKSPAKSRAYQRTTGLSMRA